MNSGEHVISLIKELKSSGIPLSDAAWEAAKACVGWPYIYGDRGANCTPSHRQAAFAKWPDMTSIRDKCQALKKGTGCSGCKWFPKGKRVRAFDCRGFTYFILHEVYGFVLDGAGATSQWNTESNWRAKGEVADGIPQGVIVCLFYYKKDQNGRRTKTLAHTGLYYNGETIECSSGVQHSKTLNKKWEVWGVPACEKGDVILGEPQPQEPGQNRPTLRRGSKGPDVKEVQEILAGLGYDLGSCGIDSDYGKMTAAAVTSFQKDHGLKADGICGKNTWTALLKAAPGEEEKPAEKKYTVTIRALTADAAKTLCAAYPDATMTEEGGDSNA